MRRLIPLLLALALPAHAADKWTTPRPGVRLLERTTSKPWRIYALQIDLCHDGVSLRVTSRAQKRRTVPSFADLVDAAAAVNGDFFSYDNYDPTGLAMHGGQSWHDDFNGSGESLFGDDRAWIALPGHVVAPPSWAREAVGGRPTLVADGAVPNAFDRADCAQRNPRTAIGLSRDRRTLYLATVDGRSSASVGMTCAELASLMHGLGAWWSQNMDGGGSSTMWVAGRGVVNDPSDGSPRVVADHLAVLASGSAPPGSCDFSEQEPVDQGAVLDEGSTDVDGDGRADACGRGVRGLDCHLSRGGGFGPALRLGDLADAAGFDAASAWSTIRFGDVNGDGAADVCARNADGLRCWPGGAGGFGAAIPGPPLSDAHGWGAAKFYTTLRLADVDGDGRADVCARAAAGVRCWIGNGAGFGDAIIGPELSDAAGWDTPDRYGTLRFGDIDGDGRADLCARAAQGVRCWRSLGDSFSAAIAGPAWSDANGFTDVAYWSTFRLADADGDGRADVCIRTSTDFRCALSNGAGFADPVAGPALSNANGWADHDNYGTIRLGDVDGDGRLDLCARADARAYCWLSPAGAALFSRRIDGPALSDAQGWGHFRFHLTMRLADVDGDGRDDLCARASAGLRCWPSTGAGFADAIAGPEWSDAQGWDAEPYFSSLRLGGRRAVVAPPPPPDAGVRADAAAPRDAVVPAEAAVASDAAVVSDAAVTDAARRPDTAAPDASPLPDAAPPTEAGPPAALAADHHGGCATAPGPALPLWPALLLMFSRRRRA